MDRLSRLILNELHIQLQHIQGHLVDHIKGRIPAAKIIHLDHKAQFPETGNRIDDLLWVFRISAFRDLQMEP